MEIRARLKLGPVAAGAVGEGGVWDAEEVLRDVLGGDGRREGLGSIHRGEGV